MTNDELDKLKELAERARVAKFHSEFEDPEEIHAFHVAVSPDTALELISEVRSLRAENETLKTKTKVYLESATEHSNENNALRAQLAEAREVIETCDRVDCTFTRAYLEKYK